MATIFPLSASVGQIFQRYVFDGTAWNIDGVDEDYPEIVNGKISESVIPDTFATVLYVDEEIANIDLSSASAAAVTAIVDSAPSTLNTLNELAAALGDDPNFATTITELIATKVTSVPGIINQFAGSESPTGWLFCEGQEVLIETYPNLYDALTSEGTVFPYGANTDGSGEAGETHFRIPNFKGRVPVGLDSSQTEFNVLGEVGGAKTHILTSAEMPTHAHSVDPPSTNFTSANNTVDHLHSVDPPSTNFVSGNQSANHAHTWSFTDRSGGQGDSASGWDTSSESIDTTRTITTAANNANHTHTTTVNIAAFNSAGESVSHNHITTVDLAAFDSASAGDGGAHNNLQPYITINYIIKT
jgi:microcystin-dependent protein